MEAVPIGSRLTKNCLYFRHATKMSLCPLIPNSTLNGHM